MGTGCRAAMLCVVMLLTACGGKEEGEAPSRLETAMAVVEQVATVTDITRERMSAGHDAAVEEAFADLPACKPADGVGGDCPQGAARLVCINELLMAEASPEVREHMRATFLDLYRSLPQAHRAQMMEQGEQALAQAGKGCVRS